MAIVDVFTSRFTAHIYKTSLGAKRFKSITTISMFDSGKVRQNGYMDSQLSTIQARLQYTSKARAQEAAGGKVIYVGDARLTDEQIAQLPFERYRQGINLLSTY